MSTTINYNGINLTNCTTRRFEQTVMRDESNTDRAYFQFLITVTTYVPNAGNDGTQSAAETEASIRAKLMQDRKSFVMKFDGKTLIEVNAPDSDNGPKPISCNITKPVGDRMLFVEYTIQLAKNECDGSESLAGQGGIWGQVAYNRWALTDSLDENNFTERTIRGQLRVKQHGVDPNLLRGLVMPPLEETFKPMGSRFEVTPDWLKLNYEIRQKQHFRAAPNPGLVTSFTATHTISTNNGATMVRDFTIKVMGGPSASKLALLNEAVFIAEQKMGKFAQFFTKNHAMIHMAVIDDLHDSSIQLQVRLLAANVETVFDEQAADLDRGINRTFAPQELLEAGGLVGAYICHLQTPCNNQHAPPVPSTIHTPGQPPFSPPVPGGGGGVVVKIDAFKENQQSQDQATTATFYTDYFLRNQYRFNEGTVAAAIAGAKLDAAAVASQTAAFASLHNPIAQRVVTITAQRVAGYGSSGSLAQPAMPQPVAEFTHDGVRHKLASKQVMVSPPVLGPDQSTYFSSVEMELVYNMDKSPTSLAAGKTPTQLIEAAATAFNLNTQTNPNLLT